MAWKEEGHAHAGRAAGATCEVRVATYFLSFFIPSGRSARRAHPPHAPSTTAVIHPSAMLTAIQIGHSTRPGAMGAVRGTKAPLGLGLCAQSAPKVRPQHPTPRRAPKNDQTRSPLPPCPALPWPFSSSPDHDHPAGNLPTTADLLAVTLTGIDNSR